MTQPGASLVWEKNGERMEFPLDRPVLIIGRDESCDIVVDEPLVSRAHARIERRGEKFFVQDIGSTNLTRVNGDVVAESELHHGDEIRVARATLRFSHPGIDPVAGGV
jgi:pSer/pThr/pTyr-binding forkhead associated (FHA) protein